MVLDVCLGGDLSPLLWCSWCVLQLHPTEFDPYVLNGLYVNDPSFKHSTSCTISGDESTWFSYIFLLIKGFVKLVNSLFVGPYTFIPPSWPHWEELNLTTLKPFCMPDMIILSPEPFFFSIIFRYLTTRLHDPTIFFCCKGIYKYKLLNPPPQKTPMF